MKKIVRALRDAGAKEVHLLISCPPIISPCFMGIDFPTHKELIASEKSVGRIRKELGVNSLNYLKIENLVRGIGMEKNKLCLACLNKEYPVEPKDAMRSCCG